MNKTYNNLTIDNLIKTDWFKQFNEKQQEEIMLGLEKGLDISWYAKEDFNKNQMAEIREGLEDNVDVSIYAKPEFNWVVNRLTNFNKKLEKRKEKYLNKRQERKELTFFKKCDIIDI